MIAIANASYETLPNTVKKIKIIFYGPTVQNCSVVETFAQLETKELAEFKYY